MTLFKESLETPIGRMSIVTDAEGLLRVSEFDADDDQLLREALGKSAFKAAGSGAEPCSFVPSPGETDALQRLKRYFEGEIIAIEAIATFAVGTPFQLRVWKALRTIGAGEAISYRELALRIGSPQAVRAVGHANGQNPIAVVVPCHRVIGADASLVGYGGGLDRKRWLLEHEGAVFSQNPQATLF